MKDEEIDFIVDERPFSEAFSKKWHMIDGPKIAMKELCMVSLFKEISQSLDAVKSTDAECRASLARIQASFSNLALLARTSSDPETVKPRARTIER
jgi:hypothetical protein